MTSSEVPRLGALQRFFSGLSEYVFEGRLGVVDPPLVDYVSHLLYRFTSMDTIRRVRAMNGRPVHEVVDMVAEAEQRLGTARRDVHRHIGDVTLFWSGLFPESIANQNAKQSKDWLVDCREQGKRSYFIASVMTVEDETEPRKDVLERLSRQFDLISFGLGELKREWEHHEGDSGGLLLN